MMNVLKLGGGAGVEHTAVLQNLAARIQAGEQWILVHGASAATDDLAARLGVTVRTLTGLNGHVSRYTDAPMIDIFGAAAASVNQQLSAQLSSYGVQAVGLAGPNIINARRRPIRALQNGRQVIIRDDFSGKITGIASDTLNALLDAGITPVVAPLALGEEFERLNVDGDLVAANIARELGADTLLILSNVPGLLRDVCNPASLISRFDLNEIDHYEAYAVGRMKKKLLAAREAGTGRVILADSRLENPIDAALTGAGTHILCQPEAIYAEHHA